LEGEVVIEEIEPMEPIDPLYFGFQIIVTIILVVIQSLVQYNCFGYIEAPFTVSAWLFGLSGAYFMYRGNVYLYSLILAGFMVMVFVIGTNISNGIFFDIQHLPTLVAAIHIITQKRKFDFHVIIFGTIIMIFWVWTVWLGGVAYQYFSLNFMIALSIIIFFNLGFFYAFTRKPEKEKHLKETVAERARGQGIFLFLMILILVFLLAGTMNYWQGWLFAIVSILTIAIASAIFLKTALNIDEMVKEHTDFSTIERWRQKILHVSYIPFFFLVIIIASLDGGRYHWTGELPIWVYVMGVVGLSFANFLKRWELAAEQIDAGPYAFIRHPGYLSGIIGALCMSLVLGSLWGLIPAGVLGVTMVIRALIKDRDLSATSAEYVEYMKKVKYLFIPKII